MWDELAAQLAASARRCCATTIAAMAARRVPAGPYAMDDLVDDAARADPRMGPRPGRLDRPVDGRHGRPGPGDPPPRAAARRSCSPTRRRAIPRPPRPIWAARIAAVEQGGMAAVADAVVERYLHADFRAAHPPRPRRLRAKLLRCRPGRLRRRCHAVASVDWLDRLAQRAHADAGHRRRRDVGATPEMARRSPSASPAPSSPSSRTPRT